MPNTPRGTRRRNLRRCPLCGGVLRAEVTLEFALPGREWQLEVPVPKSTRIYCSNWLSCGLGWSEPNRDLRALREEVNAIVAARFEGDASGA